MSDYTTQGEAASQFLQRAMATQLEGSCKNKLAPMTVPNAGK